jgi:hypothetical protein
VVRVVVVLGQLQPPPLELLIKGMLVEHQLALGHILVVEVAALVR